MFAPHYAAHVPHRLIRPVPLRAARTPDAEVLADLDTGDVFELLDVTGGIAWGCVPGPKLVGYVPADALAAAE